VSAARVAGPAVVALGGGHGLSATLSALRLMSDRITAIVTVAALDLVGQLLHSRGRVLPMAAVPLAIEADVVDSVPALSGPGQAAGGPGRSGGAAVVNRRVVRGQSSVAVTDGRIERLRLVPADPPACPEAIVAIDEADWIILGPGSWYTSVLPHLLVPEIAAALHRTRARRCVTLNLSAEAHGETDGMTLTQHLLVLHEHAPDLRIDAVVADPRAVEDVEPLVGAAAKLGARLLLRQVRTGDGSPHHDPLRLAAAFRDVFDDFLGDVGTPAR